MLNFKKGHGSWTFAIQYSISSNNMLSFYIHSVISYTFSLLHALFLRLFLFVIRIIFPLEADYFLSISCCSPQIWNAHFHNFNPLNFTPNFGLSQVRSHQKTNVRNFTITQSKQENSLTKLQPFGVIYIQNEHYAFSQIICWIGWWFIPKKLIFLILYWHVHLSMHANIVGIIWSRMRETLSCLISFYPIMQYNVYS